MMDEIDAEKADLVYLITFGEWSWGLDSTKRRWAQQTPVLGSLCSQLCPCSSFLSLWLVICCSLATPEQNPELILHPGESTNHWCDAVDGVYFSVISVVWRSGSETQNWGGRKRRRLPNRRKRVARAGREDMSYHHAQGRLEILRAEDWVLLHLWRACVLDRDFSFHVHHNCLVLGGLQSAGNKRMSANSFLFVIWIIFKLL